LPSSRYATRVIKMKNLIPNHIAIIMDGNRRWAKNKNQPTIKGHQKGLEVAKEICISANELEIKNLTLYAFSIQNWSRPKLEITSLFNLFLDFFENKSEFFFEYNLKFNPIGRIDELDNKIKDRILSLKEKTKENTGTSINVAINYGGREEIIDIVNKIISQKHFKEVDDKIIKELSYLPDIPEPELLIRTAGLSRVSNFLLWHIAYSEIEILEELWPDFTSEKFLVCIKKYQSIDRKFGGSSSNE